MYGYNIPPLGPPESDSDREEREQKELENLFVWRLKNLMDNFEAGKLTFEEMEMLEEVARSTVDVRRFSDLIRAGATARQAAEILL